MHTNQSNFKFNFHKKTILLVLLAGLQVADQCVHECVHAHLLVCVFMGLDMHMIVHTCVYAVVEVSAHVVCA